MEFHFKIILKLTEKSITSKANISNSIQLMKCEIFSYKCSYVILINMHKYNMSQKSAFNNVTLNF